MTKFSLSVAITFSLGTWALAALADNAGDTAYCQQLAAQWTKYRSSATAASGPSVGEYHTLDCSNPQVQIPQLRKMLADSGHAVPDGRPLTLEQRVEALEKKVK
jgi:hypothetical protein